MERRDARQESATCYRSRRLASLLTLFIAFGIALTAGAADWYVGYGGNLYLSQDHNYYGLFLLDTGTGNALHVGVSGVHGGTVGLSPGKDPNELYGSMPWSLLRIATDGSHSDILAGFVGWEGLAYDATRDILYAANGNLGLFMILDSETGMPIASLPAPSARVQGLAYDSSRNLVYAIGWDTPNLMAYNPALSTWSIIGDTSLPWLGGGLAYDPGNDILYAVGHAGGANLYTIDPETASTSLVGPTGLSSPVGRDSTTGGLAFLLWTIQQTIDAASPGDTIHVGLGTYVENLLVDKALTILGGGGQYVEPYQLGHVICVTADGVTIDGLDVSKAMAWYLGMQCDGIHVTADGVTILHSVVHDNASEGIEVYGEAATIVENIVSNNGVVLGSSGIGVLVTGDLATVSDNLVTGNGSGIVVMGNGGTISENVVSGNTGHGIAYQGNGGLITGNTVTGNQWGISVFPGSGTFVALNVISGNHDGLDAVGSTDTVFRYNAIEGNNPAGDPDWGGLWVAPDSPLTDAMLNWWGSVDGPTQDIEGDGIAEYNGGGDWVIGPAIFSPWLGSDPDGVAAMPGVQLISPMLLIVDDVGPPPSAGYLNAAIAAANSTMLPGVDTIEVRHGTYDASWPITEAATIKSETGSAAHTHLLGDLSLGASNILLGGFRNGFTVHGDVAVLAGHDASAIHINWNDLLGLVGNNGLNILDATFNWWGGNHPATRTIGFVDYWPWLALPSDTIIGFVDLYDLEIPEAMTMGELVAAGLSEAEALVALEVMNTCGYTMEEAITLVEEVGWIRVASALRRAMGDCEQFAIQLAGYGFVGGGGGLFAAGAGGATGQLTYEVGESILVYFVLTHPFTGEVIPDAVVSAAISRPVEDEYTEILFFDVAPFNEEAGEYQVEVDTTGWAPGVYDVWVGTGALDQFEHTQVTLVAPAE